MWDIVLCLSFLNCLTVMIETLQYFGTSKTNYQLIPYKFSEELDVQTVVYPGIFSRGGSTNSVEYRGQREGGSEGGSPLVRGSRGSCKLAQEISFHIVTFS